MCSSDLMYFCRSDLQKYMDKVARDADRIVRDASKSARVSKRQTPRDHGTERKPNRGGRRN